MGRYNQNILQWNKNDMKSTKITNGDYYLIATKTRSVNGLYTL